MVPDTASEPASELGGVEGMEDSGKTAQEEEIRVRLPQGFPTSNSWFPVSKPQWFHAGGRTVSVLSDAHQRRCVIEGNKGFPPLGRGINARPGKDTGLLGQ